MTTYTIKIKSVADLDIARNEYPDAGVMLGEDAIVHADKIYQGATKNTNSDAVWVDSYNVEDCLFIKEEIEWAKEE